jgi:hypothetical protein
MTLSITAQVLNFIMLSVSVYLFSAERHYSECHYAECHYAECHYAECHYAECRYAECRGALFLAGGFIAVGPLCPSLTFVRKPTITVNIRL